MGGCMVVGRRWSSHEGMDEQDSRIYRPFILLSNNHGVKRSCSICRNIICKDKRTLTLHLCKVSFMPGYEVWTHHDMSVRQTASVVKEDDSRGDDQMDEMFDAIRLKLKINPKDPPTPEVKFFNIFRALEELLHEYTTVSVIAFITHFMVIKSKFTFSNNYYKELLKP
jgi:hypothetical protein